jgi:hypothetical protein
MEKHENYHKNVFINCPFDDKYFDLLQTLIFTIIYYGFIPRISLENSDSGAVKIGENSTTYFRIKICHS